MPVYNLNQKKGQDLFVRRLYDLMDRCTRTGGSAMTSFLSLSEQECVKSLGREFYPVFWGGYEGAERKRCFLSWAQEDTLPDVVCLKAKLSDKGREIKHPDVLGALIHSGLEREVLGDFICTAHSLYIFCLPHMVQAIQDSLFSLKGQKLQFEEVYDLSDIPSAVRETIQINVSSLRIDAIVAALAHCSRSKASMMIHQGYVKVNDKVLDDNGRLSYNDVISVRRTGKFQFVREVNKTRKDRLVLEFLKYS